MAMVRIIIVWELSSSVSGLMTNRMVMGMRYGLMVMFTKVLIRMVKRMVKVYLILETIMSMKASSRITIFMDGVSISGLMVKSIRESGVLIKCMVKGSLFGMMARCMKESMSIIRGMVLANSSGLVVNSILDIGRMVNSMVVEYILIARTR